MDGLNRRRIPWTSKCRTVPHLRTNYYNSELHGRQIYREERRNGAFCSTYICPLIDNCRATAVSLHLTLIGSIFSLDRNIIWVAAAYNNRVNERNFWNILISFQKTIELCCFYHNIPPRARMLYCRSSLSCQTSRRRVPMMLTNLAAAYYSVIRGWQITICCFYSSENLPKTCQIRFRTSR